MFKSYFNGGIRAKLFWAFMTAVLIPLIGTGFYGNWITSRIIENRVMEAAAHDVLQRAQQIEGYLANVQSDVRYINNLDSLQYLFKARANHDEEAYARWRRQLERDMLIFSLSRPAYYQVRYLDEQGKEIARVDTIGGMTHIVPTPALQNKQSRYYFDEAMRLGDGEVYISALDLNREHGEIERPLHPVIRYATPVFYQNERRGIVIINVDAEAFLQFLNTPRDRPEKFLLVDQQGFYLMHPDPNKRWGCPRDLDTGYSLQKDYPEISDILLAGKSGNIVSRGVALSYTPVFPLGSQRDSYWMLLRVESTRNLFASLWSFRLTAALILTLAAGAALLMTTVLARQFSEPLVALQQGVQRFGQGLQGKPLPVRSHDEIGQLTQAFNEMALLIQQHFAQLNLLNQAGVEISSHLERDQAATAIGSVAHQLLGVDSVAVLCFERRQPQNAKVLVAEGAPRQEPSPHSEPVLALYEEALQLTVGQVVSKEFADTTLCCAPLRIGGERTALIELRCRDDSLRDPWNLSLLSSLATQSSIALENVSLYESLANHRQRLSTLVEDLINAQEEERKIVAYDLHDGLIQYLVGARLHMRRFASLRTTNPQAAETALEEGMKQLATAIREGRHVIEGLRPTLLDNLGLEAAVRALAEQMSAGAGWQLHLDLNLDGTAVTPALEITVFRIVQEALTNARKYAQAEHVTIELRTVPPFLNVVISDNGRGFDVQLTEAET
ncbi:MAG: HAMP domain-containing protein, partial [Chloroflexi bacterium]|nr:HAMP domain-containing protein [Chloroflexota bacterium]